MPYPLLLFPCLSVSVDSLSQAFSLLISLLVASHAQSIAFCLDLCYSLLLVVVLLSFWSSNESRNLLLTIFPESFISDLLIPYCSICLIKSGSKWDLGKNVSFIFLSSPQIIPSVLNITLDFSS